MTNKPPKEFLDQLADQVVRVTTRLYSNYHKHANLPSHFGRLTPTKSGVGGMVLNFFTGVIPSQYTEIFTPLKTFLSGRGGSLASLRTLIDDHLRSLTSETPSKTTKRTRQNFFNPINQGTNGAKSVTPTAVTPTPPLPPSIISPTDKEAVQVGDDDEKDDTMETSDEEGETPHNPTKKQKQKPNAIAIPPVSGQGKDGTPRPPIPPSIPPGGKDKEGDNQQ